MKKLFFVLLMVSLIVPFAYAEQSAQTFSTNKLQRFDEQQVFVTAYNNSGSSISSNWVVILDTSASHCASGSSLGTYITTTTSASSPLVFGVTDQTIANGAAGRVCVRGPHKCFITSIGTASAGSTLSTTTTAGSAVFNPSTYNVGTFGVLLSATAIGNNGALAQGGAPDSTHTGDGFTTGDGTSNYWVWVGGTSR